MKILIVILSDTMTDGEINLINKIYSKMNLKMYDISFNILRDKSEAEAVVEQTFFKIIDNIEEIAALSYTKIESYCLIMLKNEIMNIVKKRQKTQCVKNTDYFKMVSIDEFKKSNSIEELNKFKSSKTIKKTQVN